MCKADLDYSKTGGRFVRIPDFGVWCSEGHLSALPASDALNAALRTNVVEGADSELCKASEERRHGKRAPFIRALGLMY